MSTPKINIQWRKLFAEGIVIVASILLAFLIDAAWDNRQDRIKEASYLKLLERDLELTLESVERFGGNSKPTDRASEKLAESYYLLETPPEDSLANWFVLGSRSSNVQVRLGTVQTLINSGDLRLIRNDSLRNEVSNYLTTMVTMEGNQSRNSDRISQAQDELTRHVNIWAIRLQQLGELDRDEWERRDRQRFPEGALRSLSVPNLQEMVRSEEIFRLLTKIRGSKGSNNAWRNVIQNQTLELLEMVKKAQSE